MGPDDLLCSRNARPGKALVGRAQWKINQPPSLRDNERAWNGSGETAACSLCSQSTHDKKDWKGTHVGPVLPERAP